MREILLKYLAFLYIIHNYVVDKETGKKYFEKILKTYKLSINMINKKEEFIYNNKKLNKEFDKDLLAIGLVISNSLLKETNDLMCKLNNDMETLHDIDKFFKEKAPK